MRKKLLSLVLTAAISSSLTFAPVYAADAAETEAEAGTETESEYDTDDISPEELFEFFLETLDTTTYDEGPLNKAIFDCINEHTADTLPAGDVLLNYYLSYNHNSEIDDEGNEITTLFGDFRVCNFDRDGDTLILKNKGGAPGIITLKCTDADADAPYEVIDTRFGTDNSDDLQKFREETGTDAEYFAKIFASSEAEYMNTLVGYFNSHPEITKIQDGDETITPESAKKIVANYWVDLYYATEGLEEE